MNARSLCCRGAPLAIAVIAIARPSLAQGWEPNVDVEPSPTPPQPADAPPTPSSGDSHPIVFHFEAGADGDYASPPIRGGTNPFGIGLGAHAAFTADDFYFGARASNFLGAKDVDVSYAALLIGAEFGYEIHLLKFGGALLTLRPQVGVGDAVISYTDPSLAKVDVVTSASGSSSSSTSDTIRVNNIYVDPGATAMLSGGIGYVSVNGSLLMLPGVVYGGADATTWISYATRLSAGLRF